MLVPMRPSNEVLLRARVPGAQDQRGCHSISFACAHLQAGSTLNLRLFVLRRLAMWVVFLLLLLPLSVHAENLGELSANPYSPDSTSNPFGAGLIPNRTLRIS